MAGCDLDYLKSKVVIVRVVILALGCLTIGLMVIGGFLIHLATPYFQWVLSAYIISWCLSLISFVLIVSHLSDKISWKYSFEEIDFVVTLILALTCLTASIVLAIHTGSKSGGRIAACFFGFLWTSAYALEGYLRHENASEKIAFLWSPKGIIKVAICFSGCLTVALLDAGGFRCWDPSDNCDVARTWALSAYVISWSVSVIILLFHVTGRVAMISFFSSLDCFWSIFSFFHFLLASTVVSCYMKCVGFAHLDCGARLASVIFGVATAVLYLYEAYKLKTEVTWLQLKPVEVEV